MPPRGKVHGFKSGKEWTVKIVNGPRKGSIEVVDQEKEDHQVIEEITFDDDVRAGFYDIHNYVDGE